MSEELTIQQIMENTPKVFVPEKAEGVNSTVQFDFTGKEASQWVLAIENGTCTSHEGTIENPTMIMTIDSDDYIGIITGKLDAMAAFMQGKVRVKGDMMLAMNFTKYFRMGAAAK